ncbi:MalY/PatB family protein [Cellulomonas hominis]
MSAADRTPEPVPELEVDEARLRAGTGVKWRAVDPDVLPAWVADMDFPVADVVRAALRTAVDTSDLGYPYRPDGDPVLAAFEQRMRTRYGWTPEPGCARTFTDLIQVLQVIIEHTTRPGDGIALHVPSYPPFLAAIERAGRRIVPLPVVDAPGGWDLDVTGTAGRLAAEGVRMLVVVNPHNPTGRVLTRADLGALADVAAELDLVVLSDEIHADLVYDGRRHVPFASLSADAASRTITATSATKAFSIAGLRCAVAHVGPAAVRERLAAAPLDYFGAPSVLGSRATVAAWQLGDAWLDAVVARLQANRDRVVAWASATPGVRVHSPEGTYLAWLDLSRTALPPDDPAAEILRRGRVLLNAGAEFAQHTPVATASYARLNFATGPQILERVLDRVTGAL